MFLKLLLLFTVVPFIELAILIRLGEAIGLWETLTIVVITGILGSWLAKREGLSVIGNIKSEMAQGGIPGRELVNCLLVLTGGVLLITPGIITDFVGFMLIVPGPRDMIREKVIDWFRKKVEKGTVNIRFFR